MDKQVLGEFDITVDGKIYNKDIKGALPVESKEAVKATLAYIEEFKGKVNECITSVIDGEPPSKMIKKVE